MQNDYANISRASSVEPAFTIINGLAVCSRTWQSAADPHLKEGQIVTLGTSNPPLLLAFFKYYDVANMATSSILKMVLTLIFGKDPFSMPVCACKTCGRPCLSEYCSLGCAIAERTAEAIHKAWFPPDAQDEVITVAAEMIGSNPPD